MPKFNRIVTGLTASFLLSAGAHASQLRYAPDSLMVETDAVSLARPLTSALEFVKNVTPMRHLQWECIHVKSGTDLSAAAVSLRKLPGVVRVEPNYIRRIDLYPNDQYYPQQYSPSLIGADNVWDTTLGSLNVTIADIDTGIDFNNSDFNGKIVVVNGSNVVGGNSNPVDDEGHGTSTAAIAAANTNDSIGIAGICGGAQIMPIKVLDSTGTGTSDQIIQGIQLAVDSGANVLNLSFGGPDFSQAEQDAITYATSHNRICCAAAGNDGTQSKTYPAAYAGAIAVGASDQQDAKASFSNYGSWVQVTAPGVSIYCPSLGSSYDYGDGTSLSTPLVAGACALLESIVGPTANATTIENALFNSCDQPRTYQGNSWVQYGRINVRSALRMLTTGVGNTLVTPVSFGIFRGSGISGSLGNLYSKDGSTVSVNSVVEGSGLSAAALLTTFTVANSPGTFSKVQVQLVGTTTGNSPIQVFAYDFLKRRFEDVSNGGSVQSSGQTTLVDFTPGLTHFFRNNTCYIAAYSRSGDSNPFTLSVDQLGLLVTRAN